jgi:hypothetical protein
MAVKSGRETAVPLKIYCTPYIIVKVESEMLTKVTRKTTKKRTEPMEAPSVGMNLTRTFDSVSPTTTLYEIIAI